jgi:hypothetical protein
MMRNSWLLIGGLAALLAASVRSHASVDVPSQSPQIEKSLLEKQSEMARLKGQADSVSKRLAELAAKGDLTTSQEAVQLLRAMVEELAKIQESLSQISKEIEGLRKSLDSEKKDAALEKDVANLKKTKFGGYIQFQYRDTNQEGGASDAFSVRRARLGMTHAIDPQTSLRVSFDLATGTTANNAQLRDAFAKWDFKPSGENFGADARFGQMPIPLGYELERSSSDREFPERAIYNRTLFAGERSRGINVRYGIGGRDYVHVGGWNALSTDDPEQRNIAPGPQNKLGMTAGARFHGSNWEAGISGFAGERPSTTTTRTVGNSTVTTEHPEIDRQFLFVDGLYKGFLVPEAFVRGELMFGKDRVPVTPGVAQSVTAPRGQSNMRGYNLVVGYNLNPQNQLTLRREEFDSDLDVDGDAITLWGAGYSYFINPSARLSLTREWVNDGTRVQNRYHITTLRVVFKF